MRKKPKRVTEGATGLWGYGLCFLLGILIVVVVRLSWPSPTEAVQNEPTKVTSSGPWGDLEITEVSLEPPTQSTPHHKLDTLVLKLRVTPQSDLENLVAYWGQGSRGKTMRPFLESLVRIPKGTSVSVSFFFPAFARLRLYTFPETSQEEMSVAEDSFWTALNFSREIPETNHYSAEQAANKLRADYSTVKTNDAFGDVIVLQGPNGAPFHVCVHIADDVVFTRLGTAVAEAWILKKFSEVAKRYPPEAIKVVYRKNTDPS